MRVVRLIADLALAALVIAGSAAFALAYPIYALRLYTAEPASVLPMPVADAAPSRFGPGGQLHYFAHLERVAPMIRIGDRATAGDVLGYVGSSGNARGTPPHLHYGIYGFGGGAFNPYSFLQPDAAAAG